MPDAVWQFVRQLPSRMYFVHSGLYSMSAYVCTLDFSNVRSANFANYCYTATASEVYDFVSTDYAGSLLVSKQSNFEFDKNPVEVIGGTVNNNVNSTTLFGFFGYGGLPASIALSNHTLAFQVYTHSFGTRLVNLSNSSNISTTKRTYLLICDALGTYSFSAGYTGSTAGYVFYQNTTARTSSVQNYVSRTRVTAHYVLNDTGKLYISNYGWSRFTLSNCAYETRIRYPSELDVHPAFVAQNNSAYALTRHQATGYNAHGYLGDVYKADPATWDLQNYESGAIAKIQLNWSPLSIITVAPYNKISVTGAI